MGYVLKVNFGSTFVQYKLYYWTFLYTIKPSATDLTSSSYIHLLFSNIDLDINAEQFPYLRQRLTRR